MKVKPIIHRHLKPNKLICIVSFSGNRWAINPTLKVVENIDCPKNIPFVDIFTLAKEIRESQNI